MRRVVCAANRFEKVIVVGPRHYDMTMHHIKKKCHPTNELFSEDIY